MAESPREQRELVLAPNEFCYVQNTTDGGIVTCVGPLNVTLGQSEKLILFDPRSKQFVGAQGTNLDTTKQKMVFAPAGWYVVVLNPSDKAPAPGKKSSLENLNVGKRIVQPGPTSFALWPGQMAQVIEGHRLRSNEYLLIEIYDDQAAKENWSKATVKTASTGEGEENKAAAESIKANAAPTDLANGKRYIIKGTEIAFYIPPTGVKVVEEENPEREIRKGDSRYVRQAISLENLEYAILLDENGEKEYLYGPSVVFPKPTQNFIRSASGKAKYKAIELDARKGLYIKVIEDYDDSKVKESTSTEGSEGEEKKVVVTSDGTSHKAGEELFITGDGIIYLPRKEHSIIKYGNQEIHYAITIPEGEGWYVLDRVTGEVTIKKGPAMFLPDPRKQVITRRILSDKEVALFYPGNRVAAQVNQELRISNMGDTSPSNLSNSLSNSAMYLSASEGASRDLASYSATTKGASSRGFGGDSIDRSTEFTKPRTVILDTKYMGAVPINIWTGYAVKVVDKTGAGRVEVGPKPILLEYDETLEPMGLSTGKPKTTSTLFETVYLKTSGNKVSDIIEVDTVDMIKAKIKVSYRVDFIGEDPMKWFFIENYVKFLCDHVRSIIKSVVRKIDILTLHLNLTDIVRDNILGVKAEGETERAGMLFIENNMKIYDVEVLDLEISNAEIQKMIFDAEKKIFSGVLAVKAKEQEAEISTKLTELSCQIMEDADRVEDAKAKSKATVQANELEVVKKSKEIADENLKIEAAQHAQDLKHQKDLQNLDIERMQSETKAAQEVAKAFDAQLVQAINNLKDATVVKALSENFKDLSVLKDQGLLATAERFLDIIPKEFLGNLAKVVESSSKE